ncbi:hypothetical protein D9O36_20290 [Zobellia amurskyensis]|uniref:Uncharacterized protein n=1 Tax=Zobellia amurskyensis TaxID=248905 RepID=A0A7X3D3D7_9FLAO|nr:hypothetical protein [Zobellia amurskyensis]
MLKNWKKLTWIVIFLSIIYDEEYDVCFCNIRGHFKKDVILQSEHLKNVKLDATAVNLLIRYALNGKYTGRNNA